jgi:negative regulator of sigma E activity
MKQEMGDQGRASGCCEAMSRLIDGELDGGGCRALVQTLTTDERARQDWVLLNIACDAIRSSETAALHATGFVTRVSAALANEPVVLAPRALGRRQSMLRRVILPAAAVAAAAAVVVVVAVPQLRAPGSDTELAAKGNVEAGGPVIRSGEFEAYLEAHRDSSVGPLTSRDYVMKATLKTEPR